jgi:hypothetical protein
LPSGAVRLVRLSALTRSSIWRTASLGLDIGFLLDVHFSIAGSLRGLAEMRSLWHLVCQKCPCQGTASDGSAEKQRQLDILAFGMPKIKAVFFW